MKTIMAVAHLKLCLDGLLKKCQKSDEVYKKQMMERNEVIM